MSSEAATYKIQPYYGEADDMHSWTISEGGTAIAELYAELATGQIMNVWTAEDRRGEGLARKVYEAAEADVDLFHSPDEHCTPEGLAFKNAMGGATIADADAYDPEN